MGKFSQYKVHLASLADGKYEYDFKVDSEFFKNMENSDILSCDVDVHLDLVKKNEAYDFTFTFKGMLQIKCDRCLDPMDQEVDTAYHITVKYGESYEDISDELLVIPDSDAFLNVAYMLYDTILLTIPLRHVHPAGKCNRAMAAIYHKHHTAAGEEVEEALDEVDSEIETGDTDE